MSRARRGLVVVALALVAWGCREAEPPPDVVVITVDTLRADYLGAYGSTRVATPHVDRIAAEGTLFENAAAPMPVTRPSHFSLFTGRYPREHGVTDNHLALPESELTLAEVFRDAGYQTAAFTGVSLLGPDAGVAQGFEVYDAPPVPEERRAQQVVEQAAAWLRGAERDRPLFLWVHVFDPHLPYDPPAFFRPGRATRGISWSTIRAAARRLGGDVPEGVVRRALAFYAAEVEAVDNALGLLDLELADRRGRRGVLTVFTADHGECFDHGQYFAHADCLYDGAVRVPLIVRYPDRIAAGRREAAPVELVDLAATLAAVAGLDPPESFGGRPLFDRRGGPARLADDHYALIQYPLSDFDQIRLRERLQEGVHRVMGQPIRTPQPSASRVALRSGRWKYIASRRPELYDLRSDPGETRNLAAERPETVRELAALARRRLAEHPLKILDAGELAPEMREQLRALGYL